MRPTVKPGTPSGHDQDCSIPRYEEEALYPSLVDFAIASARRLVELTDGRELSEPETSEAVRLTRGVLPHVSDCEGLTIMVELFPEPAVESVLEARDRAREEGLDILTWARKVRTRPV